LELARVVGLRKKGRPIPTNDIWIAAHAIETGADLISSDPHFDQIDDLPWIAFPAV
jgi:predicted nucleic acid-binding protein